MLCTVLSVSGVFVHLICITGKEPEAQRKTKVQSLRNQGISGLTFQLNATEKLNILRMIIIDI